MKTICYLLNVAIIALLTLCTTVANATGGDSSIENKSDFLQQVYFSGANKAGLKTKIETAMAEMKKFPYTDALYKQYSYLEGIQPKAEEAKDACEILELLSVGIYTLDPDVAKTEHIGLASDKAKARTVDAVGSLSKIGSSANGLRNTATEVGVTSWLYSGGKSTGLLQNAGKVANTANTVGGVANTASKTAETVSHISGFAKSMGISLKKDKSCSQVPVKTVAIGTHNPPVTIPSFSQTSAQTTPEKIDAEGGTKPPTTFTMTIISITGASSASLRALSDSLKNKPGVKSVQKSFNEILSSITVIHLGQTDDLADWIDEKFRAKYKMPNYTAGKITLIPAKGKS